MSFTKVLLSCLAPLCGCFLLLWTIVMSSIAAQNHFRAHRNEHNDGAPRTGLFATTPRRYGGTSSISSGAWSLSDRALPARGLITDCSVDELGESMNVATTACLQTADTNALTERPRAAHDRGMLKDKKPTE